MTEGNITYIYIYIRYIMDSHHTNKTYQEEYKEQLKNMIDEQIGQHIEMERRGDILRCRMTKKNKQPQTATLEYYNIEKDGDKLCVGPVFLFNFIDIIIWRYWRF